MKCKALLLTCLLLLSSCSLSKGTYPANPVYYEVEIVNRRRCDAQFVEIQGYLASHGILLNDTAKAQKKFICVPDSFLAYLTPIAVRGLAEINGKVGYSVPYTKTMLHELAHLMWGFEHGARGIMFPVDEIVKIFATGLTEEQIKYIRGER